MTLDRAIRLARVWAFGGVCTLQDGKAQAYHKLALAVGSSINRYDFCLRGEKDDG